MGNVIIANVKPSNLAMTDLRKRALVYVDVRDERYDHTSARQVKCSIAAVARPDPGASSLRSRCGVASPSLRNVVWTQATSCVVEDSTCPNLVCYVGKSFRQISIMFVRVNLSMIKD